MNERGRPPGAPLHHDLSRNSLSAVLSDTRARIVRTLEAISDGELDFALIALVDLADELRRLLEETAGEEQRAV